MPRVSKTSVEFPVTNQITSKVETWVAKFFHNHVGVTGKLMHDGRLVQHVTTCYVYKKGCNPNGHTLLRGTASCSLKADYKWQRLVKQAFMAAIAKAGVTRKRNRKLFGEAMQSFFHELRYKAYPPHNEVAPTSVEDIRSMKVEVIDVGDVAELIIDRTIIPAEVKGYIHERPPVGAIPYKNQHGLGYTGAD